MGLILSCILVSSYHIDGSTKVRYELYNEQTKESVSFIFDNDLTAEKDIDIMIKKIDEMKKKCK